MAKVEGGTEVTGQLAEESGSAAIPLPPVVLPACVRASASGLRACLFRLCAIVRPSLPPACGPSDRDPGVTLELPAPDAGSHTYPRGSPSTSPQARDSDAFCLWPLHVT